MNKKDSRYVDKIEENDYAEGDSKITHDKSKKIDEVSLLYDIKNRMVFNNSIRWWLRVSKEAINTVTVTMETIHYRGVKPFKTCEKRSSLGTEKKEREKHQKDRICTYVPRDLVH